MKCPKVLAIAFMPVGFACLLGVTSAQAAQASGSKKQLTQFFDKVTKINENQEALAGQAITNEPQNTPIKTYANMVKWDDQGNQ
jgi:hypothetical protein